jgi:hypothetical protein
MEDAGTQTEEPCPVAPIRGIVVDRTAGGMECLVEIVRGGGWRGLWPEPIHNFLSGETPARRESEERDQMARTPGSPCFRRAATWLQRDTETTQELDDEC